jgi:uncharacterized membrane protein YgdD (TMEM256/DUF423 family)
MNKQIVITASVFGVLAVIAGAFAAHGLKAYLSPQQLDVWHTAVQYQFYHVFALLFLSTFAPSKISLIKAAYYFFTFGILFFSGSLYFFAGADVLNWNYPAIVGLITPIGGLCFILGWIMLGLAAFRGK